MQVYFSELLKEHLLFGLFLVQYLLNEVTNLRTIQTEMNRTPAGNSGLAKAAIEICAKFGHPLGSLRQATKR